MFHIYFIKSKTNNKIYTGFTEKDPKVRLRKHNSRSNSWSSSNGPFMLLYFEAYCCKEDAIRREKFYKEGFGKLIRNSIIKTIEENKFMGA